MQREQSVFNTIISPTDKKEKNQNKTHTSNMLIFCVTGLAYKMKQKFLEVYESSNIHSTDEFVNILKPKKNKSNLVFLFQSNVYCKQGF